MTSSDLRRAVWIPLLAAACGGGSSTSPAAVIGPAGPNVVPISVNGAGCSATAYFNEPCVSATVCIPGTSTCQVVNNLLLDTGSTGLRVFSQALTLPLPAITAPDGNPLGTCIGYLDGSSQWGPVVKADVILGGEPAVTVPIQRIDSRFATAPSACTGAQTDPASAGYNGILGVDQWMQDCGDACTTAGINGPPPPYFSCGAGCTPTVAPLASQVTNPVAALPTDGNGIIVRLPAVPAGGARSISGELVLGIGTRTNNVPPASVVAFPLDGSGELRTAMGGNPVPSFLDTGSNGLFFPSPTSALTICPAPDTAWFCPAVPVSLTATNFGVGGSPSGQVTFQIASIDALAPIVAVSSQVGGPALGARSVDWGLPFHLGRDVYIGIEGRSSGLGTGPLVAY